MEPFNPILTGDFEMITDYTNATFKDIFEQAGAGNPKAKAELDSRFKEKALGSGAIPYLQAEAEKGNARAQNCLGLCHLFETDNEIGLDPKLGMKWLLRAAVNGDAEAQSTLGTFYMCGVFVDGHPDPNEAVRWYNKAAKQGNTSAQIKLGIHYCAQGENRQGAYWLATAASKSYDAHELLFKVCAKEASLHATIINAVQEATRSDAIGGQQVKTPKSALG
ncbi:MAG: tetratricopeptide repeat protein [Bdellovibrionales bacterium]